MLIVGLNVKSFIFFFIMCVCMCFLVFNCFFAYSYNCFVVGFVDGVFGF